MRKVSLLGVMLLVAGPLSAQRYPGRARERAPEPERERAIWPAPHAWMGLSLQVGQASGIFSNYVQAGIGGGGYFLYRPDAEGVFGLRAGGMFMIYGSQTRRYPLLPGIAADVTTRNEIIGMTLGPQLTFGRGAAKLYGYGGIGFSYFATRSSVEGSGNVNQPFASTTNYDDFTVASEGGGGVWVSLSRGRTPVALDLGVRYLNNGRVTYVTESGVRVVGNNLEVDPIDSEANLIVYHFGVAIGLRARHYQRGRDDD
jgi:hypothetical protein